MLSTIEENCPSADVLSSNLCFHISPYSDTLLTSLGGDFTRVPEGNYGLRSAGGFYSNPELEQIAVVTFSGTAALKSVGAKLGKLLGLFPVVCVQNINYSIYVAHIIPNQKAKEYFSKTKDDCDLEMAFIPCAQVERERNMCKSVSSCFAA